jgi:hypothetical protein
MRLRHHQHLLVEPSYHSINRTKYSPQLYHIIHIGHKSEPIRHWCFSESNYAELLNIY